MKLPVIPMTIGAPLFNIPMLLAFYHDFCIHEAAPTYAGRAGQLKIYELVLSSLFRLT
jgi:hypothetical protein